MSNGSNKPQPPSKPQQQVQVQTAQFSGPLPHPNVLAQYNAVVPGAAERIIAMAENDARHLQEMESISLKGAFAERRLGQIFGLIIGLAGFITSITPGSFGHPGAAAAVGGSTLVGLVAIFVVGRLIKTSE